jgi:hypothetical protein
MDVKGIKGLALMVLLGAAVFALPFKGPVALIKIPKVPGPVEPQLARLRVDVRQELGSCYLALADGGALAGLRRAKVRFAVLDPAAGTRDILVVRVDSAGAIDALRARGTAIVVEPGTAVFWTDTGSLSEAVPDGLPRKALSGRSILPYFSRRPAAARPVLPAAAPDPLVQTIVSLVSGANLSASVQTLQDFQTRYASTVNCEAAGDSLFAAFTSLGLDEVRFEPFTFASYTSRNVIAEKTGETYPDDVFIVCSHYDSISPAATRQTLAPGADDNASGTAAVLEAARILAAFPLDFTVRFIAFSAEEWGLFGSRAHAAAARLAGERILGVINMDMIAYADALPEDLQIIVNPASGWLADLYLDAATNYGPVGATKTVDASFLYSDHSPFWDAGYPALLAIEDNPLNNPYYHQITDTIDKLDIDFFTSAARASLGLLSELAQPVREGYPSTPAGLQGRWTIYSSLFNRLQAMQLTWTAQADAVGYNVYRSETTHAGYVKINDAPVAGPGFTDDDLGIDPAYYYVVTAVGPTGLESNRSIEIFPFVFYLDGAIQAPSAPFYFFRRRF